MASQLYLLLAILLAGDSTLPNGIRIYDLSTNGKAGEFFEASFGYRTAAHFDAADSAGLAIVVRDFLKITPSARAMAVAAYGSGGEVEFFSDPNRVGMRVKVPPWARPMIEESIAGFFSETPQRNASLIDRVIDENRSRMSPATDVRARAEAQFQLAMLGAGGAADFAKLQPDSVERFFAKQYGTDRAFVIINGTPPKSLAEVARRSSESGESGRDLAPSQESALRIQSDLDDGAVILGAPSPSIYYRNWYALLMLDRLIQEVLPQKPVTRLSPSLQGYFYRLEVPVPLGQLAAAVETKLRQDLEQLQYVRASSQQLELARNSALHYLESESVQQWFVSLGVPERRLEGVEWLRTFEADDMRVAARDLVQANPVAVSWSPRLRTLRLDMTSLSDVVRPTEPAAVLQPEALGPAETVPFPIHQDVQLPQNAVVRLDSGISIVPSSKLAVFVTPNNLQTFDRPPDSASLQTSFGAFRSDRILVLVPPELWDTVRPQWESFRGNARDQTAAPIIGNFSSAEIPALLILKMLLDRRLIEAGLWNDIQLAIRASEGSTLTIHASEANRRIVLGWIREIAARPPSESEMVWAREAAIHHLPEFRLDLQILFWQWNPVGNMIDLHLIPAARLQEIAKLYLQ